MKERGFTLVEMSIVLIIIGLLVGGVLAGKELITASQVRNALRQYAEFNTSVEVFRNKYGCLPGDCTGVSAFGFDSGSEGNGDGLIGECSDTSTFIPCSYSLSGETAYKEYFYFWYQLSAAGMIKDSVSYNAAPAFVSTNYMRLGTDTPTIKLKAIAAPNAVSSLTSSGWGVQGDIIFDSTGNSERIHTHAFIFGRSVLVGAGNASSSNSKMGGYQPAMLYRIDSKLDDGLPLSGSVRAWGGMYLSDVDNQKQFTLNTSVGSTGAAVCISNDTGGNYYNVSYSGSGITGLCNLLILGGF